MLNTSYIILNFTSINSFLISIKWFILLFFRPFRKRLHLAKSLCHYGMLIMSIAYFLCIFLCIVIDIVVIFTIYWYAHPIGICAKLFPRDNAVVNHQNVYTFSMIIPQYQLLQTVLLWDPWHLKKVRDHGLKYDEINQGWVQ